MVRTGYVKEPQKVQDVSEGGENEREGEEISLRGKSHSPLEVEFRVRGMHSVKF